MELLGFAKTAHFVERQRQRQIADAFIALAIAWGERFYQGAEQVYFLGKRHLERAQKHLGVRLGARELLRAEGTVVVVGTDNRLITTYRNPTYIRHLRRCL